MQYTASALLAENRPRPATRAALRLHLPAAVQLPSHPHAARRPAGGNALRSGAAVQRQCGHGAHDPRAVRAHFNERVVCEFETGLGRLPMVLVGALFVGSIETV